LDVALVVTIVTDGAINGYYIELLKVTMELSIVTMVSIVTIATMELEIPM
jgi:hypothetical protein